MSYFYKSDYSQSIILSIKRISNLLEQENKKITGSVNTKLIKEEEEKILFNQIEKFNIYTENLFEKRQYKEILLKIKDFEIPINNFFNKVKIHHSNSEIQLNRLILLNKLKIIFFNIVDFSYLY